MDQEVNYKEIITIETGKRGDKPCMRITVYDILNWFASGMTRDQILADFPELTNNNLTVALKFASDSGSKATVVAQ